MVHFWITVLGHVQIPNPASAIRLWNGDGPHPIKRDWGSIWPGFMSTLRLSHVASPSSGVVKLNVALERHVELPCNIMTRICHALSRS
jgi:hypothetical protein